MAVPFLGVELPDFFRGIAYNDNRSLILDGDHIAAGSRSPDNRGIVARGIVAGAARSVGFLLADRAEPIGSKRESGGSGLDGNEHSSKRFCGTPIIISSRQSACK